MSRASIAIDRTFACVGMLVTTLLLAAGTARADIGGPMNGASAILPSRFLPGGFEILSLPSPFGALAVPQRIVADLRAPILGSSAALPQRFLPAHYTIIAAVATEPTWRLPLLERTLSPLQKAEPLAGDLIDAVARIEPIYDPTRIDGPEVARGLVVSAGTVRMESVFGDRWQRLGRDANVDAKVRAIALAWQGDGDLACENFIKTRPHRPGEPALTALNANDCRDLVRHASHPSDAPLPIAIASAETPVFAAPLPGARMSSEDFWTRRRQKIAEAQAMLHRRLQAQRRIIETAALGR